MSNDNLKKLLQAVDTAVWAWNVKLATKKGYKCKVDWKAALNDLTDEYEAYSIKASEAIAVISQEVNK